MREQLRVLLELIATIFNGIEGVETQIETPLKNSRLSSDMIDSRYRPDLVVSKYDTNLIVELKVYKSKGVPYSLLENALLQLTSVVSATDATGGILIITANIEPQIRYNLEYKFKVKIWDRGVLFYLTSNDADLRQKLEFSLLQLLQSADEDIYEGAIIPSDFDIKDIWSFPNSSYKSKPINIGQVLCKQLQSIKLGKKGAYLFEDKCEEILKYLFYDDLSMWIRQSITDDTLHKFDLIAKITSKNDFWRILARDFKTRFVIFEFKNYTEKIKQGQIYSTEKYLYSTALRTVAIIISREGADKNAILAMNGSLREQGKLIICFDLSEICLMLNMKDSGDDPNSYLSDKIDNMLMKLAR